MVTDEISYELLTSEDKRGKLEKSKLIQKNSLSDK